jgi:eukaryotic-like serine/threonine-protein kinase
MGKRLNSASVRLARWSSDPAEELRTLYGSGSRALREFSLVAPRCSVAFGASGIAYSLARAAELIDDSGLLLAANSWIAAAEQNASSKRAFVSSAQRFTRRTVGFASLAFAEPGLFYAKGIIRSRMGDPAGADDAARQFLSVTKNRLSRFADVHLGGLGLALAAKHLTHCVSSVRVRSELSTLSHSLVRRAWAQTGTDIRRNQLLGFAHGIAGQVFASYACGHPHTAIPFVQQLREVAIPFQKALIWPLRAGSGGFWAGWCNGLAGHLLMWTKVWQHSRTQDDREILDRLAWGVWKYRMPLGSLCCGAAGQALILASFSSATGDRHWNRKTLDWLRSFRPRGTWGAPPQSLFHGRLGFLLARIECEYATRPQFPVYQRDSIDLPSLNN